MFPARTADRMMNGSLRLSEKSLGKLDKTARKCETHSLQPIILILAITHTCVKMISQSCSRSFSGLIKSLSIRQQCLYCPRHAGKVQKKHSREGRTGVFDELTIPVVCISDMTGRDIHQIGGIPLKTVHVLPDGYHKTLEINLQKDKKTAMHVQVGGGIAMLVILLLGLLIVPIRVMKGQILPWLVLLAGYIAYIVLHELTHAAVIKLAGGKKVEFGFPGMYAYAGSHEDYFSQKAHRIIALTPLLVWGIVFGVLAFVLPQEWFWVVWFLQAGNIGGSWGDLYVTAKLARMPHSILILDTGVDMTVYDC